MKNKLLTLALIFKLIMITCISFAASSSFGQTNSFVLARSNEYTCIPGNPDPKNQFSCCVLHAQIIGFVNENILHLRSDQRQCKNANLRDLKFTFSLQSSSGTRVYLLSEPTIEKTPFNSKSGRKTQMWINLSSLFSFPKLKYATTSDFYPLVNGSIGVEESHIGEPSNLTFSGYYRTEHGWKKLYKKIIDTTVAYSTCPPPINQKSCRYRIDTVEEAWMNTLNGSTPLKMILKKYTNEGLE